MLPMLESVKVFTERDNQRKYRGAIWRFQQQLIVMKNLILIAILWRTVVKH